MEVEKEKIWGIIMQGREGKGREVLVKVQKEKSGRKNRQNKRKESRGTTFYRRIKLEWEGKEEGG